MTFLKLLETFAIPLKNMFSMHPRFSSVVVKPMRQSLPETAENKDLDDDTGYYWRFEVEQHKGMFKTPTVRNAALTAPYMHNGVYTTLEQVMDFYNKGGGSGLGFDLPHQTLPFDNLELTEEELASLTAFVKTLTATEIVDNY